MLEKLIQCATWMRSFLSISKQGLQAVLVGSAGNSVVFFFPWRLGCLENYGEHFHQPRFEGRKLWTTLGEAGNPGDTLEKI